MIATTAAAILHRAIAEVFSLPGYAVTTTLVAEVDNQGEPCESCQTEEHVVDATIYGTSAGGHVDLTTDCCLCCVPGMILTMSPLYPVTVEMARIDAEDDGRMASQDDVRPHPDGQ